jgi:DNA-directed RNA polymerase specialized sigma24 family protein
MTFRIILILRVFYEYSTRQIADKLDISLRTVQRDLGLALESIHAARPAVEADHGSLFATRIAKRR